MSEAPKTVWVTKYALSKGEAIELPLLALDHDGSAWVLYPEGPRYGVLVHPKGHHPTREAAVARANEMKVAKIASLKRQIERLESLEF